ncbi:acetyl-CoA hydrolase/transferase C-terminal domain-containing protein [Pleionea sediminis]|uniref:acetyl-CoA hydrolase/transferase C-terminal domain-containing protein n=1 Tax=Pleionea sediminis TaxID=2569479 RepID=UPI0011859D99|nr:acetyl-CoA hydrolase/transferase C-terminal domain-containing protein [Pleionea sediminis]
MNTARDIAHDIVKRVGKNIVLGLPLGAGKAPDIANALTQLALEDESIHLNIFTALTLVKPKPKNELQKRFLEPAADRLFGRSPELLYAQKLQRNELPKNIEVNEFFLMSGQWIGCERVQQNYIPANYTHALNVLIDKGLNVLAQSISSDGENYSLSCNPDITVDLLKNRASGNADFVFAAEINKGLPFMYGAAQIDTNEIDYLLQNNQDTNTVFSIPKTPLCQADHIIGLHAARLIKDGGTLQIGIGAIGDAICHALTLRQNNNELFNALISQLTVDETKTSRLLPYNEGLYALSEMFVDGFLKLFEHRILARKVNGVLLHGGFFLGSQSFYKKLRSMPLEIRQLFHMMPVSFTNKLEGDVTNKINQRRDARFINSAMMVTLRGAVISDALENGQVISGVGGQFDFVSQAFALPGARSIITLNATRISKGKVVSNIVWNYGHQTVPWHLRDTVITEYGIADLRGKTEAEAIKAMLNIADSRFQSKLLQQAKKAGKIEKSYQIPKFHQQNTPKFLTEQIDSITTQYKEYDLFPKFPLGSDFTEVEEYLIPALEIIKNNSHKKLDLLKLLISGVMAQPTTKEQKECLERMQLSNVQTLKDRLYRILLLGAMK